MVNLPLNTASCKNPDIGKLDFHGKPENFVECRYIKRKEGNKFEKGKKEKNYLEIMASMDKRGKDGYRIPKFCSSNSNNLNVKDAFKK